MKLGILPLGRPTFDVPYADQKLDAMLAVIGGTGHEIVGSRSLLMQEDATQNAIGSLAAENVDQVLILQVTFTDAAMVVAAASAFSQPISIWAVPEPRLGGRLRLNAFCGLNLAAHALGLNNCEFSWLYADPDIDVGGDVHALLRGDRKVVPLLPSDQQPTTDEGRRIAASIRGRRIARVGEHPTGFYTCAYDAAALRDLAGVEVDELALDDLFGAARAVPGDLAKALLGEVDAQLTGLGAVDADELDRSLRLKGGLDDLRAAGGYDAFAIRCWPETFTEYGGAVCGPAAMMGEERVPCACEADVYGVLTQLILSEAAQAPVFLTDLVDMDASDDTGVVWHCGQAPMSMCDPDIAAQATIHTNRAQPLLFQFPLRPSPVTFMRISQAHNTPQMVLGFGEMLKRPMAFTGTSGVVRFERPVGQVLDDVIASGLEHHMALAYGDHRATLRGVAGALGLPVLEI